MKVTAMIPAYNEEKTIEMVVTALKDNAAIDQVLVVDDGSTDHTAFLAKRKGAQVISLEKNQGKGAALQCGINSINNEVILMLDGDLVGLEEKHISLLLNPVLNDECDMTVGVFNHGRGITDLAQFLAPNLSGQRAVKTSIIKGIDNLSNSGYGVEMAINNYVKKKGRIKYVNLPDLTHIMKEEKRGFTKGVMDRMKMYSDIIKVSLSNLKIK